LQLKQGNISKMKDLNIIKETENPLFNRKEIQMEIKRDITPSHEEVEKLILEKFSAQSDNIKIKKISGKFGSNIFVVSVNIYKSKEDRDNTEPKEKKKKEKK